MPPISSLHNGSDGRKMNAEFFSKRFQSTILRIKLPNLYNFLLCQNNPTVIFSTSMCAVKKFVGHILYLGSILKISQTDIGTNAIQVSRLTSWGTRTNENKQDKLVDKKVLPCSIMTQIKLWVAKGFAWAHNSLRGVRYYKRLTHPGSLPIRAHPALVAYFIGGKPRNFFPNFFGYDNLGISHDMNLRERFVVVRAKIR